MTSDAGALGCALLVLAVLLWPGAHRRPPPVPSSAAPAMVAGAAPRLPLRPGATPGSGRWSASWPTWWWTRRFLALRGSSRRRKGAAPEAIAVIEAFATQVRAGASPDAAWQLALEVVDGPSPETPPLTPPSGEGQGSGAASRPNPREKLADPAWRALGAAWRLSEQTGAPLGDVLDRLAAGLRQEQEVEAEVEASLAAPRATARLLAGLPVVGVALGELIGARPVAVLIGTPAGRACALAGLLLAVAGQLWTRALVRRVARAARVG